MEYGLTDLVIKNIKNVFASAKQVDKVILYGSRAKGNYKSYSDIDITIIGKDVNLNVINKLEHKLDDLMLPYTFDISIFNQLSNIELIEHINRVGKLIYEKEIK